MSSDSGFSRIICEGRECVRVHEFRDLGNENAQTARRAKQTCMA